VSWPKELKFLFFARRLALVYYVTFGTSSDGLVSELAQSLYGLYSLLSSTTSFPLQFNRCSLTGVRLVDDCIEVRDQLVCVCIHAIGKFSGKLGGPVAQGEYVDCIEVRNHLFCVCTHCDREV